MVREGRDGKRYGENELDPLLWRDSEFLMSGESNRLLVAALAAVEALPDAEIRRCSPAQRALVQNRVWAVFDHLALRGQWRSEAAPLPRELLRTLAVTMEKLALDAHEIAAIPDPLPAAAASKGWPATPTDKGGPEIFLPRDIAMANGAWARLARANGETIAPFHVRAFGGRSWFTLQVRFPMNAPKVADYFRQLAEVSIPWIMKSNWNQPQLSRDVPDLPVGTEVALIRRLAVIDREGKWHSTPLTLSVQLRHYWVTTSADYEKLPRGANGIPIGHQSFAEFELEPDGFVRGKVGEMRAVAPDERQFNFFFAHSFDQVDGAGALPSFKVGPQDVTLRSCIICHGQRGLASFNSLFFLNHTVPLTKLEAANANREEEATANWKRSQAEWGMLQAFWPP